MYIQQALCRCFKVSLRRLPPARTASGWPWRPARACARGMRHGWHPRPRQDEQRGPQRPAAPSAAQTRSWRLACPLPLLYLLMDHMGFAGAGRAAGKQKLLLDRGSDACLHVLPHQPRPGTLQWQFPSAVKLLWPTFSGTPSTSSSPLSHGQELHLPQSPLRSGRSPPLESRHPGSAGQCAGTPELC